MKGCNYEIIIMTWAYGLYMFMVGCPFDGGFECYLLPASVMCDTIKIQTHVVQPSSITKI